MAEQHMKSRGIKGYFSGENWSYAIPPVVLSCLGILFYLPSLRYNFQFDDVANIKRSFMIRHNTFTSTFLASPRWISYWLNSLIYKFARFEPFLYRLCNVIFHTTTAIIVFYLVVTLLSNLKKKSFFSAHATSIAYMTSVLFLLHPLQTQTVSYVIQGQLEGLAGLMVLLVVLCFVKRTGATTSTQKMLWTALMYVVAFLSCGTKEIAIVSPFLVMLVDWFFVAQGDTKEFKSRLPIHASLFAVVFTMYLYLLRPAFFVKLFGLKMVSRNNIGNVLTEDPAEKIYPFPYAISQFKVILHYLQLFIWPFNMSVEYDWKMVKSFFALDCLIPMAVLTAIAAYMVRRFMQFKTDIIVFCATWFAVAIAPRSSIIPSSELMADYKTYLASFGIYVLLAAGIVKLVDMMLARIGTMPLLQNFHKQQYAMITLLAMPFGILTWQRNTVWSSGEAFWGNIVKNAPGKARAYNNLAVAISEQGRIEEAIPLYQKAIKMDGRYPDPMNNLAVSYSMLGRIDEAILVLREGIKLQPRYPEGYNNIASFLMQKKMYAEAEQCLNVAIQLKPHYGKAYFNRGKLFLEQKNYEKAYENFKKACMEADLDTEAGFKVFASICIPLEKYDDAIFAYNKLLQFNPKSLEYQLSLANVYLLKKDVARADAMYQAVLKVAPNDPKRLFTIGSVYLSANHPDKALGYLAKAKAASPSSLNIDLKIAECFHALKQTKQAQETVARVLKYEKLPEGLRKSAQETLAKINGSAKKA